MIGVRPKRDDVELEGMPRVRITPPQLGASLGGGGLRSSLEEGPQSTHGTIPLTGIASYDAIHLPIYRGDRI